MARGGRLKAAFDIHKNVDYKLERQKKLRKDAAKRKGRKTEPEDDLINENGEEESDDEEGGVRLDLEDERKENEEALDISRIDDTDSSSSENDDEEDEEEQEPATSGAIESNGVGEEDEDKIDNDEEEDIPFSDIASLNSEDRGDVVPFQRLTINNHAALAASLSRIALPISSQPFSTHQTITSLQPTSIEDVDDDLNRELQFYAQSLEAVKEARKQLKAEGVPFSRPTDYFAEMVKSEEHMGRVRQRLVDDAAGKKAASEARKQRDLKKFGKAVQVAKQQERDKAKRETLDKINVLKRKRSNALPATETEADMFDIALDNETKRPRTSSGTKGAKGSGNFKRQSKNEKYGFGGKKRHSKSNDAMSSAGFGTKGKKGAKTRPGKARRASARG